MALVLLSVVCASGVCVFHVRMCYLLGGCILVGSQLGCFICPVAGVAACTTVLVNSSLIRLSESLLYYHWGYGNFVSIFSTLHYTGVFLCAEGERRCIITCLLRECLCCFTSITNLALYWSVKDFWNYEYIRCAVCVAAVHRTRRFPRFNHFSAKLNPICHLLALLGAHPILHVGRIRVKCLSLWGVLFRRLLCANTRWCVMISHTLYSFRCGCCGSLRAVF
jgi:hypothetical protein